MGPGKSRIYGLDQQVGSSGERCCSSLDLGFIGQAGHPDRIPVFHSGGRMCSLSQNLKFFLCRPLTDGVRPAHVRESNLLCFTDADVKHIYEIPLQQYLD